MQPELDDILRCGVKLPAPPEVWRLCSETEPKKGATVRKDLELHLSPSARSREYLVSVSPQHFVSATCVPHTLVEIITPLPVYYSPAFH